MSSHRVKVSFVIEGLDDFSKDFLLRGNFDNRDRRYLMKSLQEHVGAKVSEFRATYLHESKS